VLPGLAGRLQSRRKGGPGAIALAEHRALAAGREFLVHFFTSCRRGFAAGMRTGFDLIVISVTLARAPRPSALGVPLGFLFI
jgi:hypothetical protein